MRQVRPADTRPQQVERLHMTDLKYTPLTLAMRDAVVAWLNSDPLMARLTAGGADARDLASAYNTRLPAVLGAALSAANTWRTPDHQTINELTAMHVKAFNDFAGAIADAERLVRPEDRADDRTHLLALKEIVRAHPDTNAARLLAYHEAVALMQGGEPGSVAASGFDLVDALRRQVWSRQSHDDLQRRLFERDAEIAGLHDHLSRETKSAEAASAIADELSVALEKSRERVAELEADVRAFKTLRDDNDRRHAKLLLAIRTALGCDEGATIVAEITRLREACAATVIDVQTLRRALETCREAIEGCNDIDDLLHMRDMIGLACNNVGLYRAVHPEEGPVYRWAADQGPPLPLVPEDELQLGAVHIRGLEALKETGRTPRACDP